MRRIQGKRGEVDLAALDPAVELVHLAEEIHHELGLGIVEHLVGRADLFDAALVHHQHAVGQFHRFVLVVGHEDAGQVDLVVQAAEPLPQLLPHAGVEGPERLVQQQHLRLDGQCPGQGHALPLAAGKLVRIAIGLDVQLHELEQIHDLRADLVLRRPPRPGPHPQAEGHVLEDRHVAEQGIVLEDETDLAAAHVAAGHVFVVELDRPAAGVGLLQSGDDPQERRLARSGRAEQGHQFARFHGQADVLEGVEGAEGLADVLGFDAHDLQSACHRFQIAFSVPEPIVSATRHSMNVFAASVTRPSMASSEAMAKAAE